jgi:hypothetical protein
MDCENKQTPLSERALIAALDSLSVAIYGASVVAKTVIYTSSDGADLVARFAQQVRSLLPIAHCENPFIEAIELSDQNTKDDDWELVDELP